MRAIVVGLGVQGYKRRKFAGADFVAAVDPVNPEAQYKRVEDVPLASYDAALACIPDEPKMDVLAYLLGHGKHVLVEKPLWATDEKQIEALERLARAKKAFCYTAYNHRFEPHYVRMRELVRVPINCGLAQELPNISMGMSGDFEVAIEEGSTIVRVGSAIFGSRT